MAVKRFRLQIWQHFLHFFVSAKSDFNTTLDYSHFTQSVYYSKTVWNQSDQLWRTQTKFVLTPTSLKMRHIFSATIQVSSSTFEIDCCQFAIHRVVTCSLSIFIQMKVLPLNSLLQFFKLLKSEAVQVFLSLYFLLNILSAVILIWLPTCLSRTFQIGSLRILTTALKLLARRNKISSLKYIRTSSQILKKCLNTWWRSI